MMILNYFETFNFLSIFENTLKTRPENLDLMILFLLLGAFGKSAQFPFLAGYQMQWKDQNLQAH
ncbi:MAG: hypothetical protein Ct9H90mP10_01630 [Actinomycetota bacterium]|nr:MAG: hypothetical protein Ct9H90mP10_01630 [Actinomycetota bacterium]